ncbi:hypothetical protein HAX54_019174, partial [Datura stramonium]|nr:hypothetical protein [Datura stramonium]
TACPSSYAPGTRKKWVRDSPSVESSLLINEENHWAHMEEVRDSSILSVKFGRPRLILGSGSIKLGRTGL